MPISRKSYVKYVNILIGMEWAETRKGTLILRGTEYLRRKYCNKNEKINYKVSYIDNDKNLIKNVEKEAIRLTLKYQKEKVKHSPSDNPYIQKVRKTVRGVVNYYQVDISQDVGLSQKTMAEKLGFKNRHTGRTRQTKWREEKFIDVVNRITKITKDEAYREVVEKATGKKKRVLKVGVFMYICHGSKYFYQVLCNELTVRDNTFGRKSEPFELMNGEKLTWFNSPQFDRF